MQFAYFWLFSVVFFSLSYESSFETDLADFEKEFGSFPDDVLNFFEFGISSPDEIHDDFTAFNAEEVYSQEIRGNE